jgi:hypothetical protein
MTNIKTLTLLSAVALSSILVPGAVQAGLGNIQIFQCSRSTSGSVTFDSCSGTLRKARNSPGTNDYAQFMLTEGRLMFFGSYRNLNYACQVDPALADTLAPAVIGGNKDLYFSVMERSDQEFCTLLLNNASQMVEPD